MVDLNQNFAVINKLISIFSPTYYFFKKNYKHVILDNYL